MILLQSRLNQKHNWRMKKLQVILVVMDVGTAPASQINASFCLKYAKRLAIGPGGFTCATRGGVAMRSWPLAIVITSLLLFRLLLLTHFGEYPMRENLFPPIFWHKQKIYAKKKQVNFIFFMKKNRFLSDFLTIYGQRLVMAAIMIIMAKMAVWPFGQLWPF